MKPVEAPFSFLAAPARGAVAGTGYTRPIQLAGVKEPDLLRLRGVGPNAMANLREEMRAGGLLFAAEEV